VERGKWPAEKEGNVIEWTVATILDILAPLEIGGVWGPSQSKSKQQRK